ncbi:MAG: uracil-DNA glycosylase [Chitinophagales bacterium]|nr:MAG: uracil-DNA glycosylase [Chitinophagales bacterium]
MSQLLVSLSQKIITCRKCPRLVTYREEVARTKVRRFLQQSYWGKAVPGFGDDQASLFIIGLAPAAHGANRTGRMFTGDASGDWLYRALYETGFANQPQSVAADDGMTLQDAYISAVVRCAPPGNKPLPSEIENCSTYLQQELLLLGKAKIFLCLGHIAFRQFCRISRLQGLQFGHGLRYPLHKGKWLFCSYHPSRQNTQTGRLTWEAWIAVFKEVRATLQKINPNH